LLELPLGSAFKLARLRGAGWFKPRNDGPLMIGESSDTGADVRDGTATWGRGIVGSGKEGKGEDRDVEGAEAWGTVA
jgi:hypothetical protein